MGKIVALLKLLKEKDTAKTMAGAASVVIAARKLYKSVTKNRKDAQSVAKAKSSRTSSDFWEALDDLGSRMEGLETQDKKQADLISQLASQGEALSQNARLVARRMLVIMLTSVVAAGTAIAALVVALLT